MGFEFSAGTLLLGVALSANSVSATEIATHTERLGGSGNTLHPSAVKDVSNSQQQPRLEKTKLDIKDATDTEMALKKSSASVYRSKDGTGETIPGNNPPAEPPHLALRGVRG